MANYIHALQARIVAECKAVLALEAEDAARRERATEFRMHLQSAKFQGHEQDGTLRSTIQVGDVHRWLDYIERGH
jgi:hypothetical protein